MVLQWWLKLGKQPGQGRWSRLRRQTIAISLALPLAIALLFLANLLGTLSASATVAPPVAASPEPPTLARTLAQSQLTWYGLATFKLVTPSGNVLWFDPWLRNPFNPNGDRDLAAVDRADAILISHAHFDHMGDAVAIAQKTGAALVSTFDLGKALVAAAGYPKEQVTFATQGNFGGQISLFDGEVTVAFVPAVHSSAIASDGSAAPIYGGNPGGFWVKVRGGPTLYHTGDTDLFGDMRLVSQFGPVDWMLACIGGKFTMGPDRAAEAVKLVNPAQVVPMHFGAFNLPGTPEQFQRALASHGLEGKMRLLSVGQAISL